MNQKAASVAILVVLGVIGASVGWWWGSGRTAKDAGTGDSSLPAGGAVPLAKVPTTPGASTAAAPSAGTAAMPSGTFLAAGGSQWIPQRPEFLAIARQLREGWNPYLGAAPLAAIRNEIRSTAAQRPLKERLELQLALAFKLLEQGDPDGALEAISHAFALAEAIPGALDQHAYLYRARALINLRRAELANCIARHNRDCCIFPLAGGGVHQERAPAELARQDYEKYLQLYPHDLAVRWLLNLACMALNQYPDGVPPEQLIPPSAFASEHEIARFVDVAPKLGLDTFDQCGGAIVEDFTGDGLLDVVSSTFDPEGPLHFFVNQGDGTFQDRSAASRLDDQLGGLNCIAADYDDDGDGDILVLRGAWLFDDGRIRNSLLRNDDNGVFTDVTREAGLAEPVAPTQAAVWGDFDLDGDLDLYIANEARPGDPSGGQYPSQLFRNGGDGTFSDVALSAGVTNDQFGKGVTAGDYDNDGDLDLYVSNQGPNRLYRNEGDGTFTDVAESAGVLEPTRSFATWFFDYDNDGWLDLFVAAYEAPIAAVAADHLGLPYTARHPALYRNRGDGTFEDVTEQSGLDHAYLPMGANFGDIDSDGWLDIYLATGDPNYESLMPNEMLRNDGGKRFQNVTTAAGLGHLQKGHGVAFADIDNDGDQDLYHQLGGFYPGDKFKNALFLNPGQGSGGSASESGGEHRPHFITIKLRGTRTNSAGYGVRIAVTVITPDGPRTIHRAVGSVSSFGGSPSRQEIGLGDAIAIDEIRIDWPVSGASQRLEDVPLDTFIEVTEGEAGFRQVPRSAIDL